MKRIPLGRTGLRVGAISYGCWRFSSTPIETARANVETALDAGMTLIDTADVYGYGEPCGFGGGEALLGEILREAPALRERMVLATKGGVTPPTPYDARADYLVSACEASLRRLGVEQVDLYYVHRPDLMTPADETACALDRLMADGKIGHAAVSNYSVAEIRALEAHLGAPIAALQSELSALRQDPLTDGTMHWTQERGAAFCAWSPLGGGAIVGEGPAGDARAARVRAAVGRLAEAHGATPAQVALAFALQAGGDVIPIIGTQTAARSVEAAAATDLTLAPRDWYDLVEAFRGAPMP
ncbi:MAG: aldo/keto reductase [Parvularculaceae bacterium]